MTQPMDVNSMYYNISMEIFSCGNLSLENRRFLIELLRNSERETEYSKPMPWIGMYIAAASLICTLAMLADRGHRLKIMPLSFSCKYFNLNAASLTVIAVAMKLPMDLTTPMPGHADQAAKLGSMAFMCVMLAKLLPSLATMNSKELLTNITALGILVITLIGNVCIQIYTGVIGDDFDGINDLFKGMSLNYVAMLLILLIIHISTGLTLLKSKQLIELKYQAGHETALKDLELQQPGRLTVEKLKRHVKNYWIMAVTGSPLFITTFSATTASVCGVISCLSTIMHITLFFGFIGDHQSDYNWSITVISIVQFIGSIIGTFATVDTSLSIFIIAFSNIKWIWITITEVFKVESYSTQKLYDWKQSSIPFSVRSRKIKIFIDNIKVIFLIICIGLQKTVVVACKIALIPNFIWLCPPLFFGRCICSIVYRLYCGVTGHICKQGNFKDLRRYVLQLRDGMELSDDALGFISISVNRLIKKAEKQQPCNLVKLLRESKGFEGVGKYDSLHVPPLFAEDFLDCWSLPLVTLTSIAISLPKIENDIVDMLLSSVSEGLTYVTLVEESLNATDKYVNIRKAAKVLWLEVEVSNKWLGYNLKNNARELNTAELILQWFTNTAKNMVTEMQVTDIRSVDDNSSYRSICANSMYRITESILLSYRANIDELSQDELFMELLSIIADIMAACLINLPQVIVTKCHERVIEKRVSSVVATVQLLGETTQIINNLQDRELPDLDPAELPFIEKWRDYFNFFSP